MPNTGPARPTQALYVPLIVLNKMLPLHHDAQDELDESGTCPVALGSTEPKTTGHSGLLSNHDNVMHIPSDKQHSGNTLGPRWKHSGRTTLEIPSLAC